MEKVKLQEERRLVVVRAGVEEGTVYKSA